MMRFVPEMPPRKSMRTSPVADSSITEPMKKCIPAGTPSLGGPGVRSFSSPETHVRMPRDKGISSAAQSSLLVSPSARRTVSHAVNTR